MKPFQFSFLVGICICSFFFCHSGHVHASCSFTASFTGNSVVASGDTVTYASTSVSGHYYHWVVSSGTLLSGTGTNSIKVYWPTPGSGMVILVDSTASCKDSAKMTIKIWLSARTLMASSYLLNGYAFASGGRWYVTQNLGSQAGSAWKKYQIDRLNKARVKKKGK